MGSLTPPRAERNGVDPLQTVVSKIAAQGQAVAVKVQGGRTCGNVSIPVALASGRTTGVASLDGRAADSFAIV